MKFEHDAEFLAAMLRGEHGETSRVLMVQIQAVSEAMRAAFENPDPAERAAAMKAWPMMFAVMIAEDKEAVAVEREDGFLLIDTGDGSPIDRPSFGLAFREAKRRIKSGDDSDQVIDDLQENMETFRDRCAEALDELVEHKLRPKIGAAMRLVNDPKQAAKALAFQRWQAWQAGQTIHKSGAAFARGIVESSPIESTKTVERWMKDWAAQARNRD